jgi:6-pyruvoyltetrahydropterin/6-carboxytetrahydropterin synthase
LYELGVREHFMIAHSFRGEMFGPAQRLHGATYVVDALFHRANLDKDNVVIDIGRAGELLREVLAALNYRNLDDVPELKGINTTTEFLCRHVHTELSKRIATFFEGELKITLHESHIAWASFRAKV